MSIVADTQQVAALEHLHPVLRSWFCQSFDGPTPVQTQAWPAIARGDNTLLLAPTGSGKTLAAFLVAINRLMFREPATKAAKGVRVLYISPLKALGVDVERNLRSPLVGVRAVAEQCGAEYHLPNVGVRSGDTPTADRYRLTREPPDILITTPESLYLMLTSRARQVLSTVETVIVDEIHSVVGGKRGAHLSLSLERLESLRRSSDSQARPLQRIGLSATQRPLAEVARFLGGADATSNPDEPPRPREVTVVQAGRRGQLEVAIEVPVEDMARLAVPVDQSGPAAAGPSVPSIWPSIHPRLVELIRGHRSTMIFVNSRRLAERLAAAINELAEEEIALAHHGSIAKKTRLQIEDRLKRGQLPAIVATSSLELGIDMGAVDLVIQIGAPPSIASGIQRIGRAGHQVGAASNGIIFPKYRGDLLASSAATSHMTRGEVEETFYPRNPLDVLAQQLVAMVSLGPVSVDELYTLTRQSAPFFDLPRSAFESVLDLLSGRYPSDQFSELRPRVTWDRLAGLVSPRKGTQRIAILNAGTIPDRGLYGVFLADDQSPGSRVGELDEEMVFEMRPGEVFLLGASSWRVLDITQDRVQVVPAPGEPGRMPFWRGDGPGRPLEFGRAIGELTRRLLSMPREKACATLTAEHGLESRAAENLYNYLRDQAEVTGEVPSDKTIVLESFLDEVGDWRVVVQSPFGARVHAPWATAVAGKLQAETPGEVDFTWSDDGMVFRLPEADEPPDAELFLPHSDEVEEMVINQLGSTALFAARFRENAARALLLPKRQPGRRSPLWLQRRKASDLLAVAAQYADFPIIVETYRECLRDVFDIRGLRNILRDIERRSIRIHAVETKSASPFASSLMFNYTANFIYDGDAPLAERRAATLALDHTQLRELLGDAELRELLCRDAVDSLALQLQRLDERFAVKHADGLHDLLLHLGALSRDGVVARCEHTLVQRGEPDGWIRQLITERRVVELRIAGEMRLAAVEDASRFRDALGVVLPPGLPEVFSQSVQDPLGDLVSRYARTHVPFQTDEVASHLGLGAAVVQATLERLAAADRVLQGEFLPGGHGREWCDPEVLRQLKRRSLARLRKQVEPVEPSALARFLQQWQGITRRRRGLDGVLDVIEQLQGMPLPASSLERDILPSRIEGYRVSDLDELCSAGEVIWRGFESLGTDDGRVALYLTDHFTKLAPEPGRADGEMAGQIRELLGRHGALFFEDIVGLTGGFRQDVLDAVWGLVWSGEATNDTLAPLRSLRRDARTQRRRRRQPSGRFRSRRTGKTSAAPGRWSLFARDPATVPSTTERQTAIAAQLIERYGILTREMVHTEGIVGGFAGLYPVLKAMEESGRIRRGYFVAGLGAAQFAAPGADDRIRERPKDEQQQTLVLAATDPANPYGGAIVWPAKPDVPARPQRAAGARVVLCEGILLGYLGRTGQSLISFLPDDEADRSHARQALAEALAELARPGAPVFLAKIDGVPCGESELVDTLQSVGFTPTSQGYLHRGTQDD